MWYIYNKILFLSYKNNYNINNILFGWHHQLDGHEFEKALGVGDGQGSPACCSPWGRKESDWTTEQQNAHLCIWQILLELFAQWFRMLVTWLRILVPPLSALSKVLNHKYVYPQTHSLTTCEVSETLEIVGNRWNTHPWGISCFLDIWPCIIGLWDRIKY